MKIYKISGKCPYCEKKDTIILANFYYGNNKYPYATNVPMCSVCGNDEIELRKVNNRRYKVAGKY